MRTIDKIATAIALLLIAACSSPIKEPIRAESPTGNYEILQVLPPSITGFQYQGVRTYPSPWGYSLRYQMTSSKLTYSDIYIYPRSSNVINMKHEQAVNIVTNDALDEIAYATEKGIYSEYSVINRAEFLISGKHATKTAVRFIKNNIVSYSLLYVTESNGKLIKARITMPDNDENRNSTVWHSFVTETFTIILKNIDKA